MIGCKGTTEDMSKLEKFNVFKKRTNGKIYQKIPIEVTEFNIDRLIESDPLLEKTVEGDFTFLGKKYRTIRALNRFGYYYKREIKFNSAIDIVQYLPYIIAFMSSDEDGEYIEISELSYPEYSYREHLKYGNFDTAILDFYNQELIKEYRDTINDEEKEYKESLKRYM